MAITAKPGEGNIGVRVSRLKALRGGKQRLTKVGNTGFGGLGKVLGEMVLE